jgi:hypothetical protein
VASSGLRRHHGRGWLIATVAVHSTADAHAMHVKLADEIGLHRAAARARFLGKKGGDGSKNDSHISRPSPVVMYRCVSGCEPCVGMCNHQK